MLYVLSLRRIWIMDCENRPLDDEGEMSMSNKHPFYFYRNRRVEKTLY